MFESHLTKKYWSKLELNIVNQGKGIDIGAGQSLISDNARAFDLKDGDANKIADYIDEKFDFVFSSHCLEHMHQPYETLKQWWSLVKLNGHMIILIPDEDLYEQGYFPSLFNDDHKWTFTISKKKSWSKKSINVLELIHSLKDFELVNIELQDINYQYNQQNHSCYQTKSAFLIRKILKRFFQIIRILSLGLIKMKYQYYAGFFNLPIDQTNALRQIQFILKKSSK